MDLEAVILASTAKRIFVGDRPSSRQEVSEPLDVITLHGASSTISRIFKPRGNSNYRRKIILTYESDR
jgi:hypothetical protein